MAKTDSDQGETQILQNRRCDIFKIKKSHKSGLNNYDTLVCNEFTTFYIYLDMQKLFQTPSTI